MAAQPSLFGYLALRKPFVHLVRNGTHFIANICWTNAVILLPLATVFAIEFMMPVWAGLLAVLLLGERFTLSRAGSIVLGFIGVLIILRPGIEAFQLAAIGVLVASLGYAASNIATKKLIPVQSTIAILFWMNVMQIGMALPGIDFLFPLRLAVAPMDLGVRPRLRRHVRALLPDQRAARRRRHRGHSARLPAHPADRVRRLDVLRRTARPPGVRGRGHHRVGNRVEPARRDALSRFPHGDEWLPTRLWHRGRASCTSAWRVN